jgi:hypothetical protein
MVLSTDIDLASRGVHLFSEDWRWQRLSEATSYEPLVYQGISVYLRLTASESRFRSSISCGETEYDALADLKYFALMWVWLDVSEDVLSVVDRLNEEGFKIAQAAELKRIIVESRRLLHPNLSAAQVEWDKLTADARKWFDNQNQDDSLLDVAVARKVLTVLRYKNIEDRGLAAEECQELSNIDIYPGTIIGELREHVAILDSPAISERVDWRLLHQ